MYTMMFKDVCLSNHRKRTKTRSAALKSIQMRRSKFWYSGVKNNGAPCV